MATQTQLGKAFEYAILIEFQEKLSAMATVEVIRDGAFETAKRCYTCCGNVDQGLFLLAGSFAVNFLKDLEPRLSYGLSNQDTIQLQIQTDSCGITGDVRDVLVIRKLQEWEIGVSAKNNHEALKHSRLSTRIDFGSSWLDKPCSETYFSEILPIFDRLKALKAVGLKWREMDDKIETVYVPILAAFGKELQRLVNGNDKAAKRLTKYLVGTRDFYKVIKSRDGVHVHAYNLHGTLGKPLGNKVSKLIVPKVPLPKRVVGVKLVDCKGQNRIQIELDEGWAFELRIHNASTVVEPSLKFDVQLASNPGALFKNTLEYKK